MEANEGNPHKVLYPNPWITVRKKCKERGDNNAANILKLFEVTGNHSYNCIYCFLTDCIVMGGINLQTTLDNLDYKKNYTLSVTGSIENPDFEYIATEC